MAAQHLKRSFHYDYDDAHFETLSDAQSPRFHPAGSQPIRQPSANRQLKYKLGSYQPPPTVTSNMKGAPSGAGVGEKTSKPREMHHHLHLHLHHNHANTCNRYQTPPTPTSPIFSSAPSTPTTPTTPISQAAPPSPPHIFSFPRLNTPDDPADLYTEVPLQDPEPPKKRRRLTSTILDAAVETVIFTGAVALTAYQLLTGQRPRDLDAMDETDDHSREPVFTPTLQGASSPSFDPPTRRTSLSLPTGARPYHRAHTKRGTARPRVAMLAGGGGGSKAAPSKAAKGTAVAAGSIAAHKRTGSGRVEEEDAVFVRMEAQLKSLINEGQSALKSRVEVCEFEE